MNAQAGRRSLSMLVGLLCLLGTGPAHGEGTTRILLDGVHAHNLRKPGLAPGNRDYHSLQGLKAALDGLTSRGGVVEEQVAGRLSRERLKDVDILFVNLVSSDLPAFFPAEIRAVRAFIEQGGGLLLITDHSNCYHHITKLEPLVEALDVRLWRESALDERPHAIGAGPGWIIIDSFEPHPITRDLAWIAFQTGGPVDDRHAVARLSAQGWGDRWSTAPYGENALRSGNLGNYGNWKRDPEERSGHLGVVLAKPFGRGRIVVVGDQNIFGDIWIRYGDNRRMLHNSIAWLARQPSFARAVVAGDPDHPRVMLLEDRAHPLFGSDAREGLYNAFALLGRHLSSAAHDRLRSDHEAIVVAPRTTAVPRSTQDRLAEHLRAGRSILWMGRRGTLGRESERSLGTLLRNQGEVTLDEADGRRVHRLANGARVIELLHAEHYSNAELARPAQAPTTAQARRGKAWLAHVRGLLPER